jgi:hypothetical protein
MTNEFHYCKKCYFYVCRECVDASVGGKEMEIEY